MSKKILFTASTLSHLENFHRPYIQAFENMGWEVSIAALPVSKQFFSFQNLRAVFSTRSLLKKENFDVISSQSTLAGVITRLAAMLLPRADRGRIFHTAHGYLFHDHGLRRWVYLLPEMLCGKITDVLMVMNQEDLQIARKYKLCRQRNHIYYINGMGVDFNRFSPLTANVSQAQDFGLTQSDFIWIYAAEFSKRKNHCLLLHAFAQALGVLKDSSQNEDYPRMVLALAGNGILQEEMKQLAQALYISDHVFFLGYVTQINQLYPCCKAAVSTSKIEGLPFNVMEAMACGLPVVASKIKGHLELIDDGENGLLFDVDDQDQLAQQLVEVYQNSDLQKKCHQISQKKLIPFSIDIVLPQIMKIYANHW